MGGKTFVIHMPHLISIENSESQRRQLSEKISELTKSGWALNGKFDAQNFGTWNVLLENAITPGLFVSREIIVIENAETLGAFPEKLSSMLEDDKADCMIILIFNGDAKNLSHVKNSITLIKPEAQIPPWKRPAWLIELAKSQGCKLFSDAAQLLADSIESQEELRAEIHKLTLYSEGRDIKLEDVENLSFDEGGRAQLIFLDGVCDNKPHDVARGMKYLRNGPLLPVIAALTNRLRPALIISCFPGKSQNNALKAIGTDLTKKNYALTKSRNALKNFGADAIKTFMSAAIRLSFLEKTSYAEGWSGFELILWELMTRS